MPTVYCRVGQNLAKASTGSASEIQNPWKQSHPRARKKSNRLGVTTPSAITRKPMPRVKALIAWVITASARLVSILAMKDLSILSVSIGKCGRYDRLT